MVATNAGGERVLRHGPMAEQIIGVEAVLGDGTRVGRVPALRKDNAGYHWAGILAGSEGTLAVITAVHLRLVPKLPDRVVALIALDDIDAALALSGRLRRELPELVALEVCFADGIALVAAHTGLPTPFDPPAPVVLLAEVTGRAGETDALLGRLGGLLDAARRGARDRGRDRRRGVRPTLALPRGTRRSDQRRRHPAQARRLDPVRPHARVRERGPRARGRGRARRDHGAVRSHRRRQPPRQRARPRT